MREAVGTQAAFAVSRQVFADGAMHVTPMLATLGEWAQAPARRYRHRSPATRSNMK